MNLPYEHCEVTLRRPKYETLEVTAWQNFRWDVADWFYDHWALLVIIGLLAYIFTEGEPHQRPIESHATVMRFTGDGATAQGSTYRMPHDCSTTKGMRRGWLEICGE